MNKIVNQNKNIENLIYNINGKEVMLDSDLANLYGVETKRINEAVKNNQIKFPERFSWKLTTEESKIFLVENFDQKIIELRGGRFNKPRVFTEQGVAMLATVLKSKIATQVSIDIMDAFVMMRKYIAEKNLPNRVSNVESKIIDHDNKIDLLLNRFSESKYNEHIFFEGQIYDAYSLLIDILSEAKTEIILVDNYLNKKMLDILANINKNAIIITKNFSKFDVEKYTQQYSNIEIRISNKFHDRFIILDKKILYHCGASFKDLGNKCFAITKINARLILESILNEKT